MPAVVQQIQKPKNKSDERQNAIIRFVNIRFENAEQQLQASKFNTMIALLSGKDETVQDLRISEQMGMNDFAEDYCCFFRKMQTLLKTFKYERWVSCSSAFEVTDKIWARLAEKGIDVVKAKQWLWNAIAETKAMLLPDQLRLLKSDELDVGTYCGIRNAIFCERPFFSFYFEHPANRSRAIAAFIQMIYRHYDKRQLPDCFENEEALGKLSIKRVFAVLANTSQLFQHAQLSANLSITIRSLSQSRHIDLKN